MRWTTRPEWGPILMGALAGALAVPFIPFMNYLLKNTLLFMPMACVALNGMILSVALGLITWRLMMAGFVEVNAKGVVLVRYQSNELLRWETLDRVEFAGPGKNAKARFVTKDKQVVTWGFMRTPRQDFIRMRHKIVDPILELPADERGPRAVAVLEEQGRDDLIQTIIRVYAILLAFVGVSLACLL